MAEPRKITIKLRPVGAKPAAAAKPEAPAGAAAPTPAPAAAPEPAVAPVAEAPAPEAPAATPAAPEADKRQTARVDLPPEVAQPETPAAAVPPKPSKPTIVIKKVGAATPAPAPAAEQAKRQTSRIELPPEITQQPMNPQGEATVRLKPISQTATPAPEDNTQAAKSKTARIALDSVLGGIQSNTPLSNTTQKTIKLKRSVPSPTAKPAASAPMASVGAATGEEKTIKLKRPAALGLKKDAPKPEAEPALEALESLDELEELPAVSAPVAESAGAKAFTIVGIIAAALSVIATIVLCVVLQKQAASPNGAEATGNTLHSLPFQRF